MTKLTKKMLEVESRLGKSLETYLRTWYVDEHKSANEIAEDIGVGHSTVSNWLNDLGIEIRTISKSRLPCGFVKPSEEQLRTLYIDEHKTQKEMAKDLGVGSTTIRRWLNSYGIEIRTASEVKLPLGVAIPSEKQLRTLYIDEHKTQKEIAEDIGVSDSTIVDWLNSYGIEIRTASEVKLPLGVAILSEKQLRTLYIDEHKTPTKIAEDIGVSRPTVRSWLNSYGIETRNISEAKLPPGFVKPSEKQLRTWYIDEHKTQEEIAEELGVSCPTIGNWLKDCGVNRDKEELKELEGIVRKYLEND